MAEQFQDVESLAIQHGRLWVSQVPEHPLGPHESVIVFAGGDRLRLTVKDARRLRDWLTSALPENG